MKVAEKVLEPDENKVHYTAPIGLDQVTLCGKSDWIGDAPGEPTTAPVDCWHCQQIVTFVKGHRFDANRPTTKGAGGQHE